MKKIYLSLSLATISLFAFAQTPCVDGFAGIYPCQHMDLLAYLPLSEIGGGENTNDVWGWTSPNTKKEYALVGCANGTAFIDISTPTSPVYLGLLPTHTINSLWRDLESYGNYCFIGSEAADHGLQVFNLLELDDVTNPPVTFEETAHYGLFGKSHTINIDQQTGFLYAMGTQTYNGGLHIVDINDPLNPTLAGGFEDDGYTHDGYALLYNGPDADWVGKEIFVACNDDALTIVDVDDKSDCQYISTLDYPILGYVHQGWFTKDMRYFLLDDELDEQDFTLNTRTHMFDLLDLDNPVYMGSFTYETTSIDHNLYIQDQFVYASNYRSGVRVLDASRTFNTELKEIGFFDLFPNNDFPLFSGTWSNYPFLKSGVNLATSMYDGFFIIEPKLVEIPHTPIVVCGDGSFEITINADLYFPLTISANALNEGALASGDIITGPGTYTINLSGPWTDEDAELVLSTTFGTSYNFPITIDECTVVSELLHDKIKVFPNPATERVQIEGLISGENVQVYNGLGQLVHSTKANGKLIVLNTQDYPSGVYTIRTEYHEENRLIIR